MGSSVWTTKPPLGSVIDRSHPLSKGLVGCWLINEGGGLQLKNIVNNNNSTLTKGAGGWYSNGIDFDGALTIIDTGNNPSFDNLPAITIVTLFYAHTYGEGTNGYFWGKDNGGNSGFMYLRLNTNNAPQFVKDYDGASDLQRITVNNTITYNKLTTIAVTWDGSSTGTNIHIYKDGKEASYSSATDGVGNKLTDVSRNYYIGNRGGASRTFDGIIYYNYLYSRALSPSEIQSLYVAPYQFIEKPSYTFYSIPTGGLIWSTSEVECVI